MDLPLAQQPGSHSADATIRAIKRADVILTRMIAEEKYLEGATAYTSTDRPLVAAANAAFDLRETEDAPPDAIFDALFEHFQSQGVTCHCLDANDSTWPGAMAQAIAQRGYHPVTRSVYEISGYQRPARLRDDVQIIPGRAAYGELRRLFADQARSELNADDALADQWTDAAIDQLDEPRVEVFLGRVDRHPVAVANLLTLGNVGVLCDQFTLPSHRGQGIGTTLIARVMEHCQRAQFEQVLVRLTKGSPAEAFYEKLGFRPVCDYVTYQRAVQ